MVLVKNFLTLLVEDFDLVELEVKESFLVKSLKKKLKQQELN